MLIPEQLWIPSFKDVAGQFAPRSVSRHATTSLAQAVIETTPVAVARDYVFLLKQITVLAIAGAAQTVQVVAARIQFGGSAEVILRPFRNRFSDYGLGAAPTEMSYSWNGEILLMPLDEVICSSEFNAGAAANSHTHSVHGILIPRGNWQLG